MLQELDVQTITLTTAASQAVQNILTERKLEGYALRVYVAGRRMLRRELWDGIG
ncbi:hypothetical protein [Candidatus Villigracilis saccharophilus]|uniref:hypothetical protein n=1 Tax=Candidatus Villigracilis saccharophilus TaxID=3140684 RepID=UPI003134E22C|nr:hypothetical protein [Anaerolineales bacterium]